MTAILHVELMRNQFCLIVFIINELSLRISVRITEEEENAGENNDFAYVIDLLTM